MEQFNIDKFGDTVTISFTNYPSPKDADLVDGRIVEEYEGPQGETLNEPPVVKEEAREDVNLILREDNDEVCGVEIRNFSEHQNLTLFPEGATEASDEPKTLLDVKEF